MIDRASECEARLSASWGKMVVAAAAAAAGASRLWLDGSTACVARQVCTSRSVGVASLTGQLAGTFSLAGLAVVAGSGDFLPLGQSFVGRAKGEGGLSLLRLMMLLLMWWWWWEW